MEVIARVEGRVFLVFGPQAVRILTPHQQASWRWPR
jgi:hypothetical protein